MLVRPVCIARLTARCNVAARASISLAVLHLLGYGRIASFPGNGGVSRDAPQSCGTEEVDFLHEFGDRPRPDFGAAVLNSERGRASLPHSGSGAWSAATGALAASSWSLSSKCQLHRGTLPSRTVTSFAVRCLLWVYRQPQHGVALHVLRRERLSNLIAATHSKHVSPSALHGLCWPLSSMIWRKVLTQATQLPTP